jgi:hypothetical protein
LTKKLPLTIAAAKAEGWTSIRAVCVHHTVDIPFGLIAGGAQRSLANIVKQLRCQHCGNPPSAVYLHRVKAPAHWNEAPSEEQLPIIHLSRT